MRRLHEIPRERATGGTRIHGATNIIHFADLVAQDVPVLNWNTIYTDTLTQQITELNERLIRAEEELLRYRARMFDEREVYRWTLANINLD